jgi:hypothetical protein
VVLVFFVILAIPGLSCAQGAADARPEPAQQEQQMEEIPPFIDVVILRPVGLVACAAGLAATIIALPFALPSGSMDKVTKALIGEPFYFTFKRPIGQGRVRPSWTEEEGGCRGRGSLPRFAQRPSFPLLNFPPAYKA